LSALTLTGGYLDAAGATLKRDLTIFLSYRMRVISQVATMLLTMTMFYYVSKLVRPGVVGPQGAYFAYVVVGIVALASLTAALSTAQLVRMELFSGTFERPIVSPIGPVGGAVTLTVFPVLYALALSGFMLVVAAVVFDFPVQVAGIPAALGVSALAAVAFAAIGLILVAVLIAFKSAMAASWVIAGFSILGGVYFPMKLFPQWVQWLSDAQPFTPAVDLIRHVLLGTTPAHPVWAELAKLTGFTLLLVPLAAIALRLAVGHSRRRGTLLEY
jgi:ABC-2 type transport system permease protein